MMAPDDLNMNYNAQFIDYNDENGLRATNDAASEEEWPLELVSESRTAYGDEVPAQEDTEHSFGGPTGSDTEGSLDEVDPTMAFVNRLEEMECDAPATDQDLNMEDYDGYQILNTEVPTTYKTDPNEPRPPQPIHSLHPPSGIQDAGAQTGVGMWADSLPHINVQPPSTMPGYGQQGMYRGPFQTDTTAAYTHGLNTTAAPARYATDNMQSISNFWAEAGMRPYDSMPDYTQDTTMLEPVDSMIQYPAPWNTQDWSETQYASTTQPPCGCAGTSSQVPLANSQSASTTSWIEASTSSFNSRQQDLTDSTVTVRLLPISGLEQHQPHCPHGNPIVYILPDSEHGEPYAAATASAQSGWQHLDPGEGPSSQGGRLPVPGIDDTASGPSSPMSLTSSHVPDLLCCDYPGCDKTYTGKYRRGTLQRHARMKHAEEERTYPCGIGRCQKTFARQDARLKHYRNHHPDLNLPAPSTRPRRA